MSLYLKKFSTHAEYETYINGDGAILPNVSICEDTPNEVHYNPFVSCEETSVYEIVGTPSYPSEIEGSATSFGITVNYRKTDTDTACTETVTEGTDTVTVECGANPSTSSTRTVSGTVDYHGNEIEYSIEQKPKDTRVVAKFNVLNTSSPTPISYYKTNRWGGIDDGTSGFSAIEIDGAELPSVVSAYTFSTLGEHTVKYTLKDPTNIVIYAFRECYKLTSVTIPDSVTSIGNQVFRDCRSLTSVTIPDSVTSIGNSAFYNCTGLTSIVIPSGVTSIGDSVFYVCTSLTSVTIPNSVTSIGNQVFRDCRSLTSIIIPSGVTNIGEYAFKDCRSLTSIDIPNSVTSIGGFAFQNCSGVTSVTIPNSLTSIGTNVFYGCSSLTSVTIPDSVTSIGNNAFCNCSGLTSVTVNAVTPPTLGSSVFGNTNDCPIYVPSESVETYKAASGWSTYASRIQAIS